MNKMKYDINKLTNDGKRTLLRMLCDELSYAEISKLVEPYADRLELDEMREPYIIIKASENDFKRDQKLWIDVNDVETYFVNSDD
jgi:hypothetical protein